MPVFDYQALDKGGKKIKGIIDADNSAQARTRLRSQGNYPVSIRESGTKLASEKNFRVWSNIFNRIRSQEISAMTRQLATLIGAGIPLVQALGSMIEQTRNTVLKKIIAEIRAAVNEGNTLTTALAAHPSYFPPIFVNMVRAGEASGSLDIVLEQLADFREKQEVLKGKLQAALVYPLFMAVIGTAILFVLITYIVPNIIQVFNEMEKVLPMPTLILIHLSSFLRRFWWGLLFVIGVAVFCINRYAHTPGGRQVWDLMQLRTPIIGTVVHKVILARFSVTLGNLLESGVGLLTSMQIVRALVNNVQVSAVIDVAMEQIEKGQSMTGALSDSRWFPPTFVQMVAVGEQSGSLEKMLKKVSTAYEREVETAILAMTSLLEPIMIAAMGLAVGFIVVSILLPIFEMSQLIK
ncbi:MAG: type II secretion system inner membrane protein GspF [Pseudomonadota bacterium]